MCKTETFLRRTSFYMEQSEAEWWWYSSMIQRLLLNLIKLKFKNTMFKCNPWELCCTNHWDLNGSFAEYFSLSASAWLLSLHREWGNVHYTQSTHSVMPQLSWMHWYGLVAVKSFIIPAFLLAPAINFPCMDIVLSDTWWVAFSYLRSSSAL